MKAKKAVLKGVHSRSHTKKEDPHITHSGGLRHGGSKGSLKSPRRNKLDRYTIIKFPLTTDSALKK